MSTPTTAKTNRRPQFLQLHRIDAASLRQELAAGLLAENSFISPKYLYDALGSRLFAAITELPEYYPTRTEARIVRDHQGEIATATGIGHTLVDLGAGNCEKAAGLFTALQPQRYVAVDISTDYLADSLDYLQFRYPELDLLGIGMDFSTEFSLPEGLCAAPSLVLYPGSSIGNFSPDEAQRFLSQVRHASHGGSLLIGVDLVKDTAILEPAYADALGVTAAFNRNMLAVANTLLGANFAVSDFCHVAFFNEPESRIEMHLEALRDTVVCWPGAERRFKCGERIHTENSYKYRIEDFSALLHRAGYANVRHWTDDNSWFGVFYAEQERKPE